MRKSKKKKKISVVIRNHNKIISSLLDLDNMVFIDLMTGLYTDKFLKEDFSDFLNMERMTEKNYIEYLSVLANTIQEKKRRSKEILDIIILRNNRYLKKMKYLELDFDDLKYQINKDIVPSMHGQGVTAEMVLLYNFSVGVFDGEEIDIIKQVYLEHVEKSKEVQSGDLKAELEGPLKGSLLETELICYINELNIQNLDEKIFSNIEEKWGCDYHQLEKLYNNVPRGLLLFFFVKFSDLMEDKAHARNVIRAILQNFYHVNSFARRQRILIDERLNLKGENLKLFRKIKRLQNDIETLKKTKEKSALDAFGKEDEIVTINRLNKENYYLKTRIETLEFIIADYEEEKRINKEIQKDIVVTELKETEKIIKPEKPDVGDFFTIVVSGGHWNSRTREEVAAAFKENEIIFIPADRTIRNIDTIGNADLVVFDTSLHGHGYYNLIKNKALKLMHINRSSLDEIKGLFSPLN